MILDGHIHIRACETDTAEFYQRLKSAGIDGGAVISLPPESIFGTGSASAQERLDNLFLWTEAHDSLFPFFWVDPLEVDAADQVEKAAKRGVSAFKVICDRFFPEDKRAMKIFNVISQTGKPILFHSGILWDGKPSSKYNRPGNFEALLEVKGLRFCLAHISWPWCDELIAVYGKFLNAFTQKDNISVEMFIDITPGTPVIYRREILSKLFTVGYDIEHNIIFGSDSNTQNYNTHWVQGWINKDDEIYQELGLGENSIKQIYAENLRRFVGVSSKQVKRNLPKPGE
jgi:predicted TIM-barrel fold metal-dependent hydrolase